MLSFFFPKIINKVIYYKLFVSVNFNNCQPSFWKNHSTNSACFFLNEIVLVYACDLVYNSCSAFLKLSKDKSLITIFFSILLNLQNVQKMF